MSPRGHHPGTIRAAVATVLAVVVGVAVSPETYAQRRGRPSAAQRAAMQKQQQMMQAYQKDVARYQKELADKHAEIMKQYDENGDGRLLGPEKSKYDKFLFDVQKGRQPNPFAGILPPGQGKEMAAATQKK